MTPDPSSPYLSLKVEAAHNAPHAMMGKARCSSLRITLISIHDDSHFRAFPKLAGLPEVVRKPVH